MDNINQDNNPSESVEKKPIENLSEKKNGDIAFFHSVTFRYFVFAVAALIILLLVFKVGQNIGTRKANFSYQWGENYHKNFAGPKGGFLNEFGNEDFIESHGVFGQILKNEGQSLVISGNDKAERIILVSRDTIVRHFRGDISPSELKISDFVVVIGEPNSIGQIAAKLIRVIPPPPPTPSANFVPFKIFH
ncbi:MAG: hypothetical protein PHC97_03205 [Patescibacteria group bacterium]|nr:hypothetical protein [Patescibacteria group bacterium]